MNAQACKHCRHSAMVPGQDRSLQRQCRRNPPTPVNVVIPTPHGLQVQVLTVFPAVTDDAWCGEHAPDLKMAS